MTMNRDKMRNVLALIFSLCLSYPVFAQENTNDTSIQSEQQTSKDLEDKDINIEDKEIIFDNLNDQTQKLNQEFNNNPIVSQIDSPFNQARFVPDIALITDFSYAHRSISNSELKNIYTQGLSRPGLFPAFNSKNGFNFNYAELALASSVDPYFDMFSNFHLSEFGFEIEEAYINTRSLPFGLQVKAGKFLSSFGRLNSQHSHYWDFSDSPLIYENLLGTHNILEKGIQLNWLLPTDLYLLSGIEILNGENERSFGNRGFVSGTNKLEDVNHPNLITGFLKTSLDFDNLIVLAGLSYAQGGSRIVASQSGESIGNMHIHSLDRELDSNEETNFAGGTRIFGADLTAKYFIDSYRYFSFQSEFLYRNMLGSEYSKTSKLAVNRNQSGLYSQLVYKFNQQWRVGARLDMLLQNNIMKENKELGYSGFIPKYTAMIDFNPTEFSRLRLQFNHDRTKILDTSQIAVNEILLQLNMAIGAHGAHIF